MTNIKSFFSTAFAAIAFILFADFLFFCLWVVSGQHPADGFYAGAMTAKIISLFI